MREGERGRGKCSREGGREREVMEGGEVDLILISFPPPSHKG